MRALIDYRPMNQAQRKDAEAIALIHSKRHWSVKKKLYKTKAGVFLVRCNKIIKIRLKPTEQIK